ncbi:MAG TPA: alpha-L-fucosidase, partial [Arachidicoccus soli]|nr:alpha-L-fucosidase [Arachidicoccus soli]
MNKAIFINSLFLLFTTSVFSQKVPPPRSYGALPNQNQLDWQENNIYAFVHFGLNTFTNKEWGYGDEDPSLFNPKDFDADQIVRSIKQGGFKGIILTCKHHDGFCLWPTKTTEHNITQSPFRNGKGDMVKEVEEACRKYGLKFGVYVSPWDRNSPKYGTEAYVKMYRAQIAELLSNYGSVFEVWHDGANGGDGYYGGARETRNIDRSTYYNWPNIWALEKKLQPQALIFGDIGPDLRWVGTEKGFAGDPCWQTYTPESRIPGKPPTNGTILSKVAINGTRNGKYWMPAEVDFSIRPGWFWHKDENNKVRSATDLWNHYFLSAGHGASMLLNIPPDTDGKIYKTDSINLKEFGDILYKTFSNNLAIGAKITASNVRGKDQKHYG